MKDYYSILGVSQNANMHEIKRAYRKLAVVYHPDKNPDPQAEALFKEINEAYDVLGDPEKKELYDQRLQNPFVEILQQEQPPRHRDPRYRPRPPGQRTVNRKPGVYELMKEYLPYIQWISYVGLVVTIVFAVDYFLPYQTVEETIEDVYVVRGRRNVVLYHVLVTDNRKVKIYNFEAGYFRSEPSVRIEKTLIYSTPMSVSNSAGTHSVRLAYLYRALILFPLILFITSALGILFRHKVEFPFNLNIVSAILLIITLVLIF